MSSNTPYTEGLDSETTPLSEITRRGMEIYDSKLRPKLEPEYNDQYIAIHPASEDYTIARSTADAMRAMHQLHPDGRLLLMKIGPEPDYGLGARLLEGEMMAARKQ